MRLLRPASEDDMVAIFRAAEVTSDRYGPQIRGILTRLGQPRGIVEQPDTRETFRHIRYDVRIGERPAAVLRDARIRSASRAPPRWPDDHRPQFRAVARTPCGEQAGDRGGTPGPRAHRRHRPLQRSCGWARSMA